MLFRSRYHTASLTKITNYNEALKNVFTKQNVDIPGLGFGQSDYYPYVYYKINVDMVDNKV